MPKIICFSGKKRSGKNTAANFVIGKFLEATNQIGGFYIDDNGLLCLSININGDASYQTIEENGFNDFNFNHIRTYSFADPLKAFCMNVFNLTRGQCYGTEKEKNSLTTVKWSDMPVLPEHIEFGSPKHAKRMTAREILQYFGTDIVRRMMDDAWVNATINKILKDDTKIAVITDARFPNEINRVNAVGGQTVRLTRDVCCEDVHHSEKALDNFPKDNYSFVLENHDATIEQQGEMIQPLINELLGLSCA